ncbi:metalloregulator ArsR/SmtB family transcription factor [soil metagenome]
MNTTGEIDAVFGALADPRRRRVIELLGAGPRASGDLARAVSLPPPAMSRHLKVLRDSGLVAEDHSGADARVRLYRLRPEAMTGLAGWIAELEAAWSQELAAFKAHVEGER